MAAPHIRAAIPGNVSMTYGAMRCAYCRPTASYSLHELFSRLFNTVKNPGIVVGIQPASCFSEFTPLGQEWRRGGSPKLSPDARAGVNLSEQLCSSLFRRAVTMEGTL